ncbi:MAG: hypothetical protein KKA79_07810 [Nanoarchaeota archaeon]|nr:hypothetical protein [Nanoarchaeota archaeon]MCG2718462.1 hypothetical protein [Nanoarchaeota archaeon]
MKSALEKFQNLEKSRLIRSGVELLLVVVTFLMLIWPHLRRVDAVLLSGKEAYYHLQEGTVAVILTFLNQYTNLDILFLAKTVPIILGLASMLIFYNILRNLKINYAVVVLSTLILIFSPSFIYLFGTLNAYAFMSFIILLALYLFIIKKGFLGVALLYLLPFFSIWSTLLALLLVLIYSLKRKRFRLFLGALPSLAIFYFYTTKTLPSYGSRIISDFGGDYGLGIFIVMLSFLGLQYLWRKKYRYISVYLMIASIILFAFFDMRILSYLNFILVTLAALGLIDLMKLQWRNELIKKLSALIIINGFIFSGLSYITYVSFDLPNEDIIEMAEYLRTLPDGNVFSHISREPWIDYSGKTFVTDKNLFYVTDIQKASVIIDAKQIKYIWLDKELEQKIWTGEEEGLQFLLEYSKKFQKKKITNYVTLWEVEQYDISD